MPGGYPGSTQGVDPEIQGVISRGFKRKKIFVMDERTDERMDERTDERTNERTDGQTDVIIEIVM